jgi:hypothetical protein
MYEYLAFILGCLLKIYDDLYDNNLYAFFNISNKKYVNEFLKISIIMAGTILYVKFYMFYILFVLFNTTAYLIKTSEYGAFELSGLVASYLLFPFVEWKNVTENINSILITIIGTIFIEKICNFINIEYSYSKLICRLSLLIIYILLVWTNVFNNQGTNIFIIAGCGYCLLSCIFQYILLTYQKEIKQSNLKKRKRKRKKEKV